MQERRIERALFLFLRAAWLLASLGVRGRVPGLGRPGGPLQRRREAAHTQTLADACSSSPSTSDALPPPPPPQHPSLLLPLPMLALDVLVVGVGLESCVVGPPKAPHHKYPTSALMHASALIHPSHKTPTPPRPRHPPTHPFHSVIDMKLLLAATALLASSTAQGFLLPTPLQQQQRSSSPPPRPHHPRTRGALQAVVDPSEAAAFISTHLPSSSHALLSALQGVADAAAAVDAGAVKETTGAAAAAAANNGGWLAAPIGAIEKVGA